MFSNFKFTGIILLLIASYAVNVMYSLILREKNKALSAQLAYKNSVIEQYRAESNKLAKELKHAESEAHKMAKISDEEVKRILKQSVSDECCKALDYVTEDAIKR